MEDLEDELLAVTQRRSDSDANDSDVADSDAEDDYESDAPDDDDDRDDDDDDELGDDDDDPEDDEDYDADFTLNTKKKTTRKSAKAKKNRSAPKKSTTKRKPAKKKTSDPRRVGVKVDLNDIEDDDEVEFQYEFDENGFGDQVDRERLMNMTEVERETLLEERVDKRNKAFDLWKKEREIAKRDRGKRMEVTEAKGGQRRSNRSKIHSKSAALNDMLDKEKSRLDDISDADSEPDRKRDRDCLSPRQGGLVTKNAKDSPEPLLEEPNSGPDMLYSDIVSESNSNITTTPLFLRREILVYLSQKPAFRRATEGLMTRVRVGTNDSGYLLCRVAGVERGDVYSPAAISPKTRTDFYLLLQSGMQKKKFPISIISDSHPTRGEFETYRNRLLKAGGQLYTREEVSKLLKKGKQHIVDRKPKIDEDEHKEHRAIMEKLYPEKVNWTVKRTEVQTALEVKQQDYEYELRRGNREEAEKLQQEVEKYSEELRQVQVMEMKFVRKSDSSSVKIFQELAAKNRAENMNMERLASTHAKRSKNSSESRVNPYARFDTTGQSYFSMGKKEDDAVNVEPSAVELRLDWRSTLKTWKFGETKTTINGNAIKERFSIAIPGLDDLVWPPKPEWAKPITGKRPPGIDAIYSASFEKKVKLPEAAKRISFQQWNKERQ